MLDITIRSLNRHAALANSYGLGHVPYDAPPSVYIVQVELVHTEPQAEWMTSASVSVTTYEAWGGFSPG